jgi:abortive infection bacteriophage resistance protein
MFLTTPPKPIRQLAVVTLKPGGLFLSGAPMRYAKDPLSVPDQARRLLERGMLCDNPARLEHYLSHIGYYRLSAYWHPYEHPPVEAQRRNHNFLPETTFEAVLNIYIFDRKLRLLVMDAIERIEVAVRTRWAGALALRHGSHAHMHSDYFKNPWQHAKDIAKIAGELVESSEPFIVHYRKKYEEPYLPPLWAIVETMTLGTLSHWFKNTKETSVKKEVMKSLNLPTIEILEEILHTLTPVRNICAHHGRLWNRRFPMKMPVIKRMRDRMVEQDAPNHQAHYIFNYLVVMEFLMHSLNPRGTWKARLLELLSTVHENQIRSMGFPDDWKLRVPWV